MVRPKFLLTASRAASGPLPALVCLGKEMGGVDAVLSVPRDGQPQVTRDREHAHIRLEGHDGDQDDGVAAPQQRSQAGCDRSPGSPGWCVGVPGNRLPPAAAPRSHGYQAAATAATGFAFLSHGLEFRHRLNRRTLGRGKRVNTVHWGALFHRRTPLSSGIVLQTGESVITLRTGGKRQVPDLPRSIQRSGSLSG
jgi:hypothetical protein